MNLVSVVCFIFSSEHCQEGKYTFSCFVQAIEGLKRGSRHDTYLCAAGYLIGEYGAQVKSTPPVEQFKLLQGPFLAAAVDTKVSFISFSATK